MVSGSSSLKTFLTFKLILFKAFGSLLSAISLPKWFIFPIELEAFFLENILCHSPNLNVDIITLSFQVIYENIFKYMMAT